VSRRQAIVFCAHHKPWLMMATLMTTLAQDRQDADLFVVYNLGDGSSPREAYREYREIAQTAGVNPQLSPFDERVRGVCQLRRDGVFELEYENDHALDSGVWYRFIRDGRWRDYDQVLFLGEGALLAHPRLLSALLDFAARRDVHFVASGHEKRRIPRHMWESCFLREPVVTPLDVYHQQMIGRAFDVFFRDPAFRSVYDRWGSDFEVETQHHVPGLTSGGDVARRARAWVQRRWGTPHTDPDAPWPARVARQLPFAANYWASRASILAGRAALEHDMPPMAIRGGRVQPVAAPSDAVDVEHGVHFHCEPGPEWFGCTVLHMMSKAFLERLSEKLAEFRIYDVLDLPFSGTSLEVIWGMLPAWLGFEKWFTDGFHRVRKNFATYRREDYPLEMASYINQYHRGRLAVGWQADYLKLRAWAPRLGDVRGALPAEYF